MNAIEYVTHVLAYEFMAIMFMLPFVAPVIGLLLLLDYFEIESAVKVLRVVAAPFLLAWLLLPPRIAHKAACERLQMRSGFYDAYQAGWVEVKTELSFLPLVGRWFAPKSGPGRSKR